VTSLSIVGRLVDGKLIPCSELRFVAMPWNMIVEQNMVRNVPEFGITGYSST
jgi:hypothetical protein